MCYQTWINELAVSVRPVKSLKRVEKKKNITNRVISNTHIRVNIRTRNVFLKLHLPTTVRFFVTTTMCLRAAWGYKSPLY